MIVCCVLGRASEDGGEGAVAFVQVEDEDKGLLCRWIQGTFRDHGCGRRGLFGLEAQG